MEIPLVNKEDVIVTRGGGSEGTKRQKEKENIGVTVARRNLKTC